MNTGKVEISQNALWVLTEAVKVSLSKQKERNPNVVEYEGYIWLLAAIKEAEKSMEGE